MNSSLRSGRSLALLFLFISSPCIADANPLSASLGQVEISETTFAEALDYFRTRSRELDPTSVGANIIVAAGVDTEREVSLHLSDASVGTALVCLVDHAEFDYTLESHAFVVRPAGTGKLATKRSKSAAAPSLHATRARQLLIEQIEFNEAPLGDVLQFVAAKSRENGQGINIVLNHTVDSEIPVTLKLNNIPAAQVLAYIAEITGMEIRDEPWAIFIDPPGTQALHEAQRKTRQLELAKKNPAPRNPTFRGKGYTMGRFPDDPRSPSHPDYVGSGDPNIPLRTNALNNVYKWVGGKWTFVRYGSGDKNKPSLNPDGTRLITPTLHSRD